ncbi:MAG: chemotaxis protein CheD [Planctomycetes bacterium]|nr:chemotaxis protein CheD [Planctomycetota bacterium]MCC7065206.1 chemotaxis protein CheD [Planctomycetota bacterium]
MSDYVPGTGIVVGVADMAVGKATQGHLVTYALGSCIGLSAFDPIAKVGALLHFMLPQPAEQADPKELKPFMYATTGIPLMFRKLAEAGARKDRLIVCAAGGAEIINDAGVFAIGKRNRTILRKIFWKDGTILAAEDTGGGQARTMTLNLSTGEVKLRTRDKEGALWAQGMKTTPVPQGKEP